MQRKGPDASRQFGFLTAVASDKHGLVGGYLVLNQSGRPLEFHCTAPVKPNRAQEILYGPTLEDYLYSEQIGRTLVAESSQGVAVICTDITQMMPLRKLIAPSIVLVVAEAAPGDGHSSIRIDPPHVAQQDLATFQHRINQLAMPGGEDDKVSQIRSQLETLDASIDLAEPFTRIRSAIAEAQGGRC